MQDCINYKDRIIFTGRMISIPLFPQRNFQLIEFFFSFSFLRSMFFKICTPVRSESY